MYQHVLSNSFQHLIATAAFSSLPARGITPPLSFFCLPVMLRLREPPHITLFIIHVEAEGGGRKMKRGVEGGAMSSGGRDFAHTPFSSSVWTFLLLLLNSPHLFFPPVFLSSSYLLFTPLFFPFVFMHCYLTFPIFLSLLFLICPCVLFTSLSFLPSPVLPHLPSCLTLSSPLSLLMLACLQPGTILLVCYL